MPSDVNITSHKYERESPKMIYYGEIFIFHFETIPEQYRLGVSLSPFGRTNFRLNSLHISITVNLRFCLPRNSKYWLAFESKDFAAMWRIRLLKLLSSTSECNYSWKSALIYKRLHHFSCSLYSRLRRRNLKEFIAKHWKNTQQEYNNTQLTADNTLFWQFISSK